MRCTRQVLVLAVVLSSLPTAARAQAEGHATASRVEVGGEGGVLFILPTYGAHVALGIAPGRSVELGGAVMPFMFEDNATHVIAQAQWRATVSRRPRRQLFVTIGGTTIMQYVHRPERRTSRPDGSVLVYPESRSLGTDAVWGPHGGFSGQHVLRGRTVVRWDVQVLLMLGEGIIPVPRVTVGVARLLGRAL